MAGKYKKRASKFAPELIEELLGRLAEGESLTSICDDDERMPAVSTVINWALHDESSAPIGNFVELYSRARLLGYQKIADGLRDGVVNQAVDFQTRRLQFECDRWLMSKVLAKLYGDKLDITSDGAPLKTYVIAPPDPS